MLHWRTTPLSEASMVCMIDGYNCFPGGDKKLYGDSSYQLGAAYINNGRPDVALTVSRYSAYFPLMHFGDIKYRR